MSDETTDDTPPVEKPKTLTEAKNRGAGVPIARSAGSGFVASFSDAGQIMEFAAAMSGAGVMVGPACRGNIGACMAVTMIAGRFGLDPFMLSHKIYIVKNKVGVEIQSWEAQAIYAMLIGSGELEGLLDFDFEGEGKNRYVTVTGRLRGHKKDHTVTSSPIHQIPVKNSPNWIGEPDQQLSYYGSRLWVRRHAPHILMGVYARDELEEAGMVDVTPGRVINEDPAERMKRSLAASAAKAKEEAEPDEDPDIPDAEIEDEDPGPEPEAPRSAGAGVVVDTKADLFVSQPEQPREKPKAKAKATPKPKPKPEPEPEPAEAEDKGPPPEPPSKPIESIKGAEAWADSFSDWYRSLTKEQRRNDDRFDRAADLASKLSSVAQDTITDALNSPAADEGV